MFDNKAETGINSESCVNVKAKSKNRVNFKKNINRNRSIQQKQQASKLGYDELYNDSNQ
jgi:hypothetical protein